MKVITRSLLLLALSTALAVEGLQATAPTSPPLVRSFPGSAACTTGATLDRAVAMLPPGEQMPELYGHPREELSAAVASLAGPLAAWDEATRCAELAPVVGISGWFYLMRVSEAQASIDLAQGRPEEALRRSLSDWELLVDQARAGSIMELMIAEAGIRPVSENLRQALSRVPDEVSEEAVARLERIHGVDVDLGALAAREEAAISRMSARELLEQGPRMVEVLWSLRTVPDDLERIAENEPAALQAALSALRGPSGTPTRTVLMEATHDWLELRSRALVLTAGARLGQWRSLHGACPEELEPLDLPLDPLTRSAILYDPGLCLAISLSRDEAGVLWIIGG